MSKKKTKILVAMSGGVDSSASAALLARAGYDVTGAFMVNYDPKPVESESDSRAGECWSRDYQDALRVAARLGIPLLRLDFTAEYERDVLRYMYAEYERGRTPNPDVLCNKFVKFGAWLKKTRSLGFDCLATGHYARVKESRGRIKLLTAKDDNKDQTYFLHQLSQAQLSRVMFPVGGYTKPQVRALAKKFGLPTAAKEESMGICFVGEVPMRDFLRKKIHAKKGKIVSSSGDVLGEHDGLAFYTIGERVGIKGQGGTPMYVAEKNLKKNILVVGREHEPKLYKKEIKVAGVNWISGRAPKLPLCCNARLRHRQPLQKCVMEKDGKSLCVKFFTPQRAVTPGQFVVFYKAGECLGGGVIE